MPTNNVVKVSYNFNHVQNRSRSLKSQVQYKDYIVSDSKLLLSSIYPRELQLNKANISEKETSFLDLNIKVIDNNIHNSVYDKHDDLGSPIVNFP